MCRDNPPSVKPKSRMPAFRPEVEVADVQHASTAGPTANCDDIPEVMLPGGVRHPSRGRLSKWRTGIRVSGRVKKLRLPALAESDGEATETASESPDDSEWVCNACTFANHNLLEKCEICESARTAEVHTCMSAEGLKVDLHQDWPSLLEAVESWTACEVSSNGSSWLDVVGTQESEPESELLTVTASGPKQTLSWLARAKSGTAGPAPRIPANGVRVPPLWEIKAAARPAAAEVDLEDDLDCRRHARQVARDVAQRRRVKP